VYHRTVKSGCRIEDRRLESANPRVRADRLEACLAIDLVVAWRIYLLTKQGRETPAIPCDVYLAEEEWKVIYAWEKKQLPPDKPPPLHRKPSAGSLPWEDSSGASATASPERPR